MSFQINYNGKNYSFLEEMPPEVRKAYEEAMALFADKNGNGMPDFLDGMLAGHSPEEILKPLHSLSSSFAQVVYNGQSYPNVEAMPPEARRAYEQAMSAVNQNRDGVPDAMEQGGLMAAAPVVNVSHTSLPRSAPQPLSTPYTPAGLEPDGPQARSRQVRTLLFVVLGITVLVFIAVAAVMVVALPRLLGG